MKIFSNSLQIGTPANDDGKHYSVKVKEGSDQENAKDLLDG